MKKSLIGSIVAALVLSFAGQSNAQILEQALTFSLSGIQAGPTTTNHQFISTPGVSVRLNSKDVISLLVTNPVSALSHARLLILSDFTGTNTSVATTIVIRGIKGSSNDVDVTRFFSFDNDTNLPPVVTGRTSLSGADAGHTTYSLGSVVIQDGTNAPILSVSGFKGSHTGPAVEWVAGQPVIGTSTSWEVSSASGFGPGSNGSIPISGEVEATAEAVSTPPGGHGGDLGDRGDK